ncbi:helix-turn-helix domain protein [mine drainage metagenome]|uniref:Helix-turn-helix domain protein n=1 Tax=mine drainage metagenome TaxID=410659 RepID=A0A1J5PS63_9ZZZZ
METKAALLVLAALSQDSRLRVFRTLVQAGPQGMSAGKISDTTGIAPSSLSFHLKELAHANLADARQEGRFVIYTANFATMNCLIGYLTENCCGGNPCSPVSSVACATSSHSANPTTEDTSA